MRRTLLALVSCMLITGCAAVDARDDFAAARRFITDTTAATEIYSPDAESAAPDLAVIFSDGLSLDEASRVALVNNRRLQAEFMRIGVARADWVQAGLLSNPSIEAAVMFPVGGGRSNVQASFAQNLMQLLRIPLRRRLAEEQVHEAVLSIARHAGELAGEVRAAYYDALAAEQQQRVAEEHVTLTRRSLDIITRQREAGVADALHENLQRGQSLAAELAVHTAALEARSARRRLARLMSVEADLAVVKLTDALPTHVSAAADIEALLAVARESRLDLQAADAAVRAADAALDLERSRAFGEAAVGGSMERLERRGGDGEGIDVIAGPAVSLEVPIFDQNQAQVARAHYLHQQAIKQREERRIAVTQEVRLAHDRVRAAAAIAELYQSRLLPQAEEGFRLAEENMRGGRGDLHAVLTAQRSVLEARSGLIRARHEAALSASALEMAVGRKMAAGSTSSLTPRGAER